MADDLSAVTGQPEALLFAVPQGRWDDAVAATLTPEQLLLYRSNLLGSDLTVTNFGGGNTSAKLAETDPLTGEQVEVLWVKGSGGDIGSMKLDGFSTLYLDKFRATERLYRGVDFEDEMVGYLPHCTFNLNPRAASIDTPLHGLLPFAHVDHVHPDAIIALAAAIGGEQATKDIWNGAIGWLPWRRPGFELGVEIREYVKAHPGLRGVMLAGHGIICWAEDSKACYDNTLALIADAATYLNNRLAGKPAFGGQIVAPLAPDERRAVAAKLMPKLRGLMVGERSKVGHFSDDADSLEFVGSADFARLAAIGTSCPDHFLRTKIAPLTLDPAKLDDTAYLTESLAQYREGYAAYYGRCAGPADPKMRDSNPIVVLVPGVGRITFAADKVTARLAGEFYGNAVNVMRGAEVIGGYQGLDEQEAFNIEYWALEEAKLQRMPKPKPMVGKVALVTGGRHGQGVRQGRGALRRLRRDRRGSGAGRLRYGGRGVRRPRHPGGQRRHRLLGAAGGDHRRPLAQELRRAGRRLLPDRPLGLPADESAGRRLDHLHRLEERPRRRRRRFGLCLGQGRFAAPRPLPGAGRRASRYPRELGEPGRGDPRLAHLGRRLASGTRRHPRHRQRSRVGGALPQALHAEA